MSTTAPSKATSLALYRSLLRAAQGFSNYNFREYAMRRVREDMRASQGLIETEDIMRAQREGQQHLALVRRQATISSLFPQGKHAME